MVFLNVGFLAFFSGFFWFWLDFGKRRGFQKFIQNSKNRVRDAFGARLGFLIDSGSNFGAIFGDFGWIWDGFWKDFEKILKAFWKDLGGQTMMRATKGKSMHGWRRPIHMRSQFGRPKTMIPAALQQFLGSFHSVTKQASFRVGALAPRNDVFLDPPRLGPVRPWHQ